jgi:flavin reductase (DIM6/NTAB) family NADH-FMN oxidoreductase RutF
MSNAASRANSCVSGQNLGAGLRRAMRRMPSSVALITTCDPETGAFAGLAASAVIPVSMEPPSMLVSINQSASAHRVIAASRRFCVNLMGATHGYLTDVFADSGRREERFADTCWRTFEGLPFLDAAPASIFCRVGESLTFGTHELFIGEVFGLCLDHATEPVVWLDGGFSRLDRRAESLFRGAVS